MEDGYNACFPLELLIRPMSTIAILSDIYSNLTAFKAVLRDVKESGARQIIFLGDIVGYGSHPAECVEWVRKLGGHCVMGNPFALCLGGVNK